MSSVIRVAISGGAIAWLAMTVDWHTFLTKLGDVNWRLAVAAFVLYTTCLVPLTLRWWQVAKACNYRLTLRESLRGYLVGGFFNTFLPTGRGGDLARGILVARRLGVPASGLLGTVLLERMVGFVVSVCLVLCFGLVAVARIQPLANVLIPVGVVIALVAVLACFVAVPALREMLVKLASALPLFGLRRSFGELSETVKTGLTNPRTLLLALGLSLANQAILIGAGFLMGYAIPGFRPIWISFFITIPLTFIAVLLPSIGGYGVREASFATFFGWFGVPKEAAITFGILRLLFMWVLALVGSMVFVMGRFQKQAMDR